MLASSIKNCIESSKDIMININNHIINNEGYDGIINRTYKLDLDLNKENSLDVNIGFLQKVIKKKYLDINNEIPKTCNNLNIYIISQISSIWCEASSSHFTQASPSSFRKTNSHFPLKPALLYLSRSAFISK